MEELLSADRSSSSRIGLYGLRRLANTPCHEDQSSKRKRSSPGLSSLYGAPKTMCSHVGRMQPVMTGLSSKITSPMTKVLSRVITIMSCASSRLVASPGWRNSICPRCRRTQLILSCGHVGLEGSGEVQMSTEKPSSIISSTALIAPSIGGRSRKNPGCDITVRAEFRVNTVLHGVRLGAVDLGRIVAEASPLPAEARIPVDEDAVHVKEDRSRRELVRHLLVPPHHVGNGELLEMLHAGVPHSHSQVVVVCHFLACFNSTIKVALL